MPRRNPNKQQLNILMPKDLYARLKCVAEADDRSIANFVNKIVKEKLSDYETVNKD